VPVDDDGNVWFGEYLPNSGRGPIRIYRYQPGACEWRWRRSFCGAIRHVHGLFRDRLDPTWAATAIAGRVPHHAQQRRIPHLHRPGRRRRNVAHGQCPFTRDAVYYGMDAEFTQNYIYRVDRRTGHRDVLQAVEGPTYYLGTPRRRPLLSA
jgi:hypothetical protein